MVDSSQGGSTSDGSAGAPSVAESAICESIPSTPETMLDNAPPRFPGIRVEDGRGDDNSLGGWPRLRKLSKDSGTELEEPNSSSCDELTPHGGEDLTITAPHGGEDLTTTLNPGLEPATTTQISEPLSSISAYSVDMNSAPASAINAPKITEIQPSLSQVYSGSHGNGSDVANSSSSTTPTNSVDNLEPACNNNSSSNRVTAANANCQNQNTDSNSNPDLQSNNHGDILGSSPMVTSQEDIKNAEKLHAVFTNLATSSTNTGTEDSDLSSITNSAGVENAALESPTQEILVVDGGSSS